MRTVEVDRTIDAPPEALFDALTDHAAYKQYPGVKDSELVREGTADPNGVGALRRISYGPIRFEEEITAYERPRLMSYVIRETNIPFEHQGGTIRLEAAGSGTRVVWTTTGGMRTPLVGDLLTWAVVSPAIRRGFNQILDAAAERLSHA